MGGYGSGRRHFRHTKAVVTGFLRLDVQGLVNQGVLGSDVNSGTVFECAWPGESGEHNSITQQAGGSRMNRSKGNCPGQPFVSWGLGAEGKGTIKGEIDSIVLNRRGRCNGGGLPCWYRGRR